MPDLTDDEERWAAADELLARWQPEPDDRRRAREGRDARLFVAAMTFCGAAVALALVLLAVDPPADAGGEPPAWRAVTGLSVAGAGLVSVFVFAVLRVPRRRVPLAWGSPLSELSSRQRRELLRRVRGRTPVAPERIRLARHSAEDLLTRRGALTVQAGLLVSFVGFWITDRSAVRTLLTLLFIAVLVSAAVQAHRDAVRAHRFLVEHPEP